MRQWSMQERVYVNLPGCCFGAMLAVIYSALHERMIKIWSRSR